MPIRRCIAQRPWGAIVFNEPTCPDEEVPLQGNATQDIEYVVDKHNKLVAVNEAWDDFALCNGAQGLMSEWVIGRDWRDFVQGDTTRMYMEAMLNAAHSAWRCFIRGWFE